MNIYRFAILPLFLIGSLFAKAQHDTFGGYVGGMFYNGDLSPSNPIDHYKLVRPAFGVFMRSSLNEYLDIKPALTIGQVFGDDALFENNAERNLSFKSIVAELSFTAEWNLLKFEPNKKKDFTPFFYVGGAAYYFNPKAEYQGTWYALQPLNTEGQGSLGRPDPYKRVSVAIPFGGGLKFAFNKGIILTVEMGGRKIFTDYLDDISTTYPDYDEQINDFGVLSAALTNRENELTGSTTPNWKEGDRRGGERYFDYYFTGGVTLAYPIYIARGSNAMGCPSAF